MFSCDLFTIDVSGYLSDELSVATVQGYHLDDTYPVINGVAHIPSDSEKKIIFNVVNPQDINLDYHIEWKNKPLGDKVPVEGKTQDYYFNEKSNTVELILTPTFLTKLDTVSDFGDISATITLIDVDRQRDFDSFSYTLIVNSIPPKPLSPLLVKDIDNNEWVLAFNLIDEPIHKDIKTICINSVDYGIGIDNDTVSILDNPNSKLLKSSPINGPMYNRDNAIQFTHKNEQSLYVSTGIPLTESCTCRVGFTDDRDASSGCVIVETMEYDGYNIYVNATKGQDTYAGTVESPLKTVSQAIHEIENRNDSSKQFSIYIEGEVTESIVIEGDISVSIHGYGSTGATLKANGGRVLHIKGSDVSLGNDVTLSGGTDNFGGGVFVESGTLNLVGSTITGNTATSNGGGIFVKSGATLNLSGEVFVHNNTLDNGLTDSNIASESGAIIQIANALSGSIGITPHNPSSETVIVTASSLYDITETDKKTFALDEGDATNIVLVNNELMVLLPHDGPNFYVSEDGVDFGNGSQNYPFNNVQAAIDSIITQKVPSGIVAVSGTITNEGLVNGGINSSDDGMIEIKSADNVHITLQGLDAANSGIIQADGTKRVMYINSSDITITLGDNLLLTGGRATTGSGVHIENGSFIMKGGKIQGNSADNGSGVYIKNGIFEIAAGTMSENNGDNGVYVFDSGTLKLRGTPVIQNTVGYEYNSDTSRGTIEIVGALKDNARIDIKPHSTGDNEIVITAGKSIEGGVIYNTITPDDLAKFTPTDGYSLWLDTTRNVIKTGTKPAAVLSEVEDFTGTYVDDGTGTGYVLKEGKVGGTDNTTRIHGDIGGVPVTRIGSNAFLDKTGLKEVIIPSSVTEIGSHAFSGCSALEEVTISDSVAIIESAAFYGTNIQKVNTSFSKDMYPEGWLRESNEVFFDATWEAISP